MDDSMAHSRADTAAFALPGWKTAASGGAAFLLAILFIVAGVWKITDPFSAAVRLSQAQVQAALSLPAALLLGIGEAYAGVLLLIPRFRRWGAWLAGVLLVAFLVYIGVYYDVLRGEECNCFPWVKRAVGPGFFIGDVVMLGLAVVAGWWAPASQSRRSAAVVLGAVAVFALASYGVNATRESRIMAPEQITADGKPFPLREGKVLLYFFDPECSHCDAVARRMAAYRWNGVTVMGVPTAQPQFAREFMQSAGLHGPISSDADLLRKTFSFVDSPYAVALSDGLQKASFAHFEPDTFEDHLRRIKFID
jgi:uncharacterized membrane protein YphA (DoxX/SURF4 family)